MEQQSKQQPGTDDKPNQYSMKSDLDKYVRLSRTNREGDLGEAKIPEHVQDFRERVNISNKSLNYATKSSEFYEMVKAIADECNELLLDDNPWFKFTIKNHGDRLVELDELYNQLKLAKETLDESQLYQYCELIVAQKRPSLFGRVELPKKLEKIVMEVRKGDLIINRIGTQTAEEWKEKYTKEHNESMKLEVLIEEKDKKIATLHSQTNELTKELKQLTEMRELDSNRVKLRDQKWEEALDIFKQESDAERKSLENKLKQAQEELALSDKSREERFLKIKQAMQKDYENQIKVKDEEITRLENNEKIFNQRLDNLNKQLEQQVILSNQLTVENEALKTQGKGSKGMPTKNASTGTLGNTQQGVKPVSHGYPSPSKTTLSGSNKADETLKVVAPSFDTLDAKFQKISRDSPILSLEFNNAKSSFLTYMKANKNLWIARISSANLTISLELAKDVNKNIYGDLERLIRSDLGQFGVHLIQQGDNTLNLKFTAKDKFDQIKNVFDEVYSKEEQKTEVLNT